MFELLLPRERFLIHFVDGRGGASATEIADDHRESHVFSTRHVMVRGNDRRLLGGGYRRFAAGNTANGVLDFRRQRQTHHGRFDGGGFYRSLIVGRFSLWSRGGVRFIGMDGGMLHVTNGFLFFGFRITDSLSAVLSGSRRLLVIGALSFDASLRIYGTGP